MASQEDAEESQTPTPATLKTVLTDSPVHDKRKCERDGESRGAKRVRPEPIRISELRKDVQMFIRADAKDRNLPGPMYQQKLSESFCCSQPTDAASSKSENATDMAPAGSPPMSDPLDDKSRDDDPVVANTPQCKTVTHADADKEMADASKVHEGQAAAPPIKGHRDDVHTPCKLPAKRDDVCEDTTSQVPRAQCPGAGSVPSGDESCDTEATGESEAFPHPFKPPDAVPTQSELSDQQIYALLLELHNKFEIMGRNVGDRGGPSITRIRSALAELPAKVHDVGDMPNIMKDLAKKQRLGKHQMREMIRRIEFFFVLAENQYKDKLAKNI